MNETGSQMFSLVTEKEAALEVARRAVLQGQCVVFPTDTVYGVGAGAFDPEAVARLLAAKRRGRDMPAPVLIAEASMVRALTDELPEAAKALVDRFWPGALTVILPAQRALRLDLGDTEGTVAVRVPDHEGARDLLRRTGPLAVSSANLSGEPAATTAEAARDMLGDAVAVYLDGGEAPGGAPSTIVDFTVQEVGRVLRPGAIGIEELREVAPGIQAD
ncbi:threonylcarbamoyl-AMP synthase [Arachnia propionica]|uniref:L-threonylcarbamoyladenylate synthase n=1 Tax=Arachnia propionica TaxID=1750 RepID=A0A3P1TDU0_9ACTN|nr:L-threonylcarbamoyladenylate synthase [Arachnia propionica]RRD07066.1 threonylcarbamoyl-AMP synthase [Arachnia propionica]